MPRENGFACCRKRIHHHDTPSYRTGKIYLRLKRLFGLRSPLLKRMANALRLGVQVLLLIGVQ